MPAESKSNNLDVLVPADADSAGHDTRGKTDFVEMINVTNNKRLRRNDHSLYIQRIKAAIEVGDENVIKRTVAELINAPITLVVHFDVVRMLNKSDYPDLALRLVLERPDAPSFRAYVRTLREIRTNKLLARKNRRLIDETISKIYPGQEFATPIVTTGNSLWNRATRPWTDVPPNQLKIESLDKRLSQNILTELERFKGEFRTNPAGGAAGETRYDEVFTNQFGQVWDKRGRLIRSKNISTDNLVTDTPQRVESAFSLLSGNANFFHWTTQRLPTVARADWSGKSGKAKILLSREGPSFEKQSLLLAGFSEDDFHFVDGSVFCESLTFGNVTAKAFAFVAPPLPVFQQMVDNSIAMAQANNIAPYEKVYISRASAKKRKLLNESDLESRIVSLGFVSVKLEEMPLWQQIATLARAKYVFGPHGAAFAHICFLPNQTKLFEIIPISLSTIFRLCFTRLAMAREMDYTCWYEPVDSAEDFTVDVDPVVAAVERWIGT
jgi:hypothetical protein